MIHGSANGEGVQYYANCCVGAQGVGKRLVMCRVVVYKETERADPSGLRRLGQPSTLNHLFLGGEVNLVGVVTTISRLLAGTGI